MGKKYVVAYFNSHNGTLEQRIIIGNSEFDAAMQYLKYDPDDFANMQDLQDSVAYTGDCHISVIEI